MVTKYDIDDTVLIPVKVRDIFINADGIRYTVSSDYFRIDLVENEINSKLESDRKKGL